MALGLRLVAVLTHDLLEGHVELQDLHQAAEQTVWWTHLHHSSSDSRGRVLPVHLGHDVDCTHDKLVQVPVTHHIRALGQGVLKGGPDPSRQTDEQTDRQKIAHLSQPIPSLHNALLHYLF